MSKGSSGGGASAAAGGVATGSKAEIDAVIAAGGTEMFRGVPDKDKAKEQAAGKDFSGQGDYGNGRYFATSAKEPREYAEGGDGKSKGGVIRAALKPGAKTIPYDRLEREYTAGVRSGKINPKKTNTSDFARSKGYDAVTVPHKGYVVVINKKAMVVQRTLHNK
jgi:hypothetical protein